MSEQKNNKTGKTPKAVERGELPDLFAELPDKMKGLVELIPEEKREEAVLILTKRYKDFRATTSSLYTERI